MDSTNNFSSHLYLPVLAHIYAILIVVWLGKKWNIQGKMAPSDQNLFADRSSTQIPYICMDFIRLWNTFPMIICNGYQMYYTYFVYELFNSHPLFCLFLHLFIPLQIQDGSWHQSRFFFHTQDSRQLPIVDIQEFPTSQRNSQQQIEIGPVCFLWHQHQRPVTYSHKLLKHKAVTKMAAYQREAYWSRCP